VIHVRLQDRYEPHTYSFARDEIVIGSAPDADLVLDVKGVAPRHVRVAAREGQIVIEDLRTSAKRQPPATVRPEDKVKLAGVTLSIELRELSLDHSDPTEEQLLELIRERPADAEVRAVYADWLEDRGHSERAQFLREQLALGAVTSAADPAFAAAADRLAALAPRVGDAWRARVAMSFIENCDENLPPHHYRRRPAPALGFELVCPMRWDRLAPTEREDVRSCSACRRNVTYCTTIEQARTLAMSGECVAVDVSEKREILDLESQVRMVGRPSPPFSRFGRRPGARSRQ
jgi:uncharacterized protein (TIGR02996 family)